MNLNANWNEKPTKPIRKPTAAAPAALPVKEEKKVKAEEEAKPVPAQTKRTGTLDWGKATVIGKSKAKAGPTVTTEPVRDIQRNPDSYGWKLLIIA